MQHINETKIAICATKRTWISHNLMWNFSLKQKYVTLKSGFFFFGIFYFKLKLTEPLRVDTIGLQRSNTLYLNIFSF